jgi:hypothetical protein
MHELMQRCDADAINKTGADSGMLMQKNDAASWNAAMYVQRVCTRVKTQDALQKSQPKQPVCAGFDAVWVVYRVVRNVYCFCSFCRISACMCRIWLDYG